MKVAQWWWWGDRGGRTADGSLGDGAGYAVCQGWPGVDFPEMVGRLEGEAVGAFGALNLPPKKFPVLTSYSKFEQGNGGHLFHTHMYRLSYRRESPGTG